MSNPLTDEVVDRSQLTDDFLFQVVDDPNGTPTARTVSHPDVLAELSDRFAPAGLDAFAPLRSSLNAGVSTAFGVVGDSTGNAANEWVALFGQELAAQYPTYTVNHWVFNTSTQAFDAPTVLQTGAGGERWATFITGSALSFPDSAITFPTGDMEIVLRVKLDDWTPATEQCLVSKFGAGGQRTFRLSVDSTNGSRPFLQWSADGTNLITANCPSGEGWSTPADGSAIWLRVTLDVDNGASGNTATFYTGSTYGTWTQVGQVVTAGVTSLFDSTTGLQLGVRGGIGTEGSSIAGSIGFIEIRDGIGGALVAPALPELWQRTGATYPTMSGAPVLSIVNGSGSGYAITDLNDATRVPKLTPNFGQTVTIVSCSHNDFYRSGAPYLADFDTLKSRIDARLPLSTLAICTQNPRTSPATYVPVHAIRTGEQVGWARRNNVGVIDAHAAFNAAADLSVLVKPTDGVHPTAAGSVLWAEVVRLAFG